MGKRIAITESERKHISKLHNLNEGAEYTFEERKKIVDMLYDYIDNWDNYPLEYCESTNEDDMDKLGRLICKARRDGKDVDSLNSIIRKVAKGDPRLERPSDSTMDSMDKVMGGFVDHMNSFYRM